MSKSDISSLFDRLESHFVGFGPAFREFQFPSNNYPPHNIIQSEDNQFILELAVAGFKKHEITVKELQGELIVIGTKDESQKDAPEHYQFRGIGRRSFEKTFKMAEFVEIVDAKLEDGILSITLMKNIPQKAQHKLIAIK